METKTYTHRVAMMVQTQIIMDVEAPNEVDSIKKAAIEAYFQGGGNQEEGFTIPDRIIIYPWLEEGQSPPEGSVYPNATIVTILPQDIAEEDEDEGEAEIINFPL